MTNGGKKNSFDMSRSLINYIPSLILGHQLRSKGSEELPSIQPLNTVVLFADISGFTKISEMCAKMGSRGCEELSFCMNRYMESIVKGLGKYGGDIIKFVGDAMIVVWPRDENNPDDDLASVSRKAIKCAVDIQAELNGKQIMKNISSLSVKLGIGVGDCSLLHVGGVFKRAEYFCVGEALSQALSSEEDAVGGDIIVSKEVWQLVKEYFEGEEIPRISNVKILKLIGASLPPIAVTNIFINSLKKDELIKAMQYLKNFVPNAIMPYIEVNMGEYCGETRKLTVMFASLGVDLSSAKTQEGMDKIQKIVTTIQKVVYRMEGSLNKLVMDDKGSTLICVWGLAPMAHEDDATRAVLAAQMIRSKLRSPDIGCWCCIGISTGVVFSGVVGTSGSRKEFSVLGDVVNVSARIMGWSKKEKGKIFVCFQTMREASPFLEFEYIEHCRFKGKSVSLPIYEPLDPEEENHDSYENYMNPFKYLKLYSNPFLIDRKNKYQNEYFKIYGRANDIETAISDILEFVNDLDYSVMISIYGESGCGKTLFARSLIQKLRDTAKIKTDWANKEKIIILASTLNSTSEKLFLNIWIPILRAMLDILQARRNMKKEIILANMYANNEDIENKIFILEKIFGLELPKEIDQIELEEEALAFIQREKYPHDIEDPILDFLCEFVKKEVLEEGDINYNKQSSPNHGLEVPPVIIFLDNVYMMDKPSWELLAQLKKNCKRICFVLLIKVSPNHHPVLSPGSEEIAAEFLGTEDNNDVMIDLSDLEEEEIKRLLCDFSRQYEIEMKDEIKKMTQPVEEDNGIAAQTQAKKIAEEMIKKYNITDYFNDIQKDVMEVIMQKCEGNPLCSMQFLINLMTNGMVITKDKVLYPSGKNFFNCYKLNDWTPLSVPNIMSAINGHLLDQYLKEGRKLNTKFVQDKVKGIILLKAASVIGEIFTLKQLEFINPLISEDIETIMEILIDLQSRDFIEIIDDNDAKNWICRFTKKFLRETLYQRLLFRGQKKNLHQLSADYIQNNTNLEIDYEIEQNRLLNHILVAEDKSTEDKLSFKAKQAITVKKLYHIMIDKKRKIVKDGFLTKQGQKAKKTTEPRYLRLTRTELQWFHNQEEAKHEKTPLGSIPFKAIYSVIPAKTDKLTSDIFIDCTAWKKKNQDKPPRKFVFGAKTESERDDWITSIEYMKTKAIVESFTQRYANITFPIKNQAPKNKKVGGNTTNFEGQTSLGSMLKRQGAIINNSSSSIKKAPYVKRASKFQAILEKKRLSNFTNDSMQPSNQEALIRDTANSIKGLFNINMTYFLGQISENAIKGNAFQATILGKKPECLRDVGFQDIDIAIKPSSMVSNRLYSIDSESSAGMSAALQRAKMPLLGPELTNDLGNPDIPQMQKMHSEKVKIHNKLDSSNKSSSFKKETRVDKVGKTGIKEIIHEEDEDLNITNDMDRKKNTLAESSHKSKISKGKERIATFNPLEDEYQISATSEDQFYDEKDHHTKEEEKQPLPYEENHIDDDPTNKEDSDEEVHQRFKENLSKVENRTSQNTQKRLQQNYELQINESKKEHPMNASKSSNSKYSIHSSENFGEKEFVVATQNNRIGDGMVNTKLKNAKAKVISIQKLQRGLTRGNNNPTQYNDGFDAQTPGSMMNASQQQARNMMNMGDLGKNHPTTPTQNPDFYPSTSMGGFSRNSNSNSPFRNPEENLGDAPNFGLGQTMPQPMNPSHQDMMQNQALNPLLTQMMMLMQQNTQIMAEQAKFIRSYTDGSKSRSRSRPRQSYHQQESRSQIGLTSYSELGIEGDEDEQPENLRNNSNSNERNIISGSIQQVNYDTRTKKIRKIAKEQFLKKKPTPEKEHQIAERTVGIVLRNTQCQINPNLRLLEGEIVTIEKYIGDLELYQCRNRNHTGLYKRDDIKISKKKGEKIYGKKKSQNYINVQQETSIEKRVEGLEHEIMNNPRYVKAQYPESDPEAQDYADEEYDRVNNYNTRISKDVESIEDILPYNSLRQGNEFAQREEAKRLSREEEFRINKQPFTNMQKEMIMEGDTFNLGRKPTNEPGDFTNHQFNPNHEHQQLFANSNKESRQNDFESATFRVDERKIPKATLRKKNKKNKQSYLNQGKPAGGLDKLQLGQPIHSQKVPERTGALESQALDESISSNNSTTKSLKMKERKNRKNAVQTNRHGVPMKGPKNYADLARFRKLN
ncbi:unnamed protein product [Moneuplotes crassus]|uniref:PH domain-containing protein n=2 Tax=Euplotes crassus TaxID=5936 RepID=A0AAD2D0G0_EUPCR|nr:unnamed protein product [Moneuplotes crassus]